MAAAAATTAAMYESGAVRKKRKGRGRPPQEKAAMAVGEAARADLECQTAWRHLGKERRIRGGRKPLTTITCGEVGRENSTGNSEIGFRWYS